MAVVPMSSHQLWLPLEDLHKINLVKIVLSMGKVLSRLHLC